MKIKTFILTFLMIMSGSILFGQNSANVANQQALKDAIAAGQFGEMSITLTNDLEVTERINIPVGYTITINLNGKTITANEDLYAFNNLGALTIKDNVGTGGIEARGIYNGANNPDGNTPVLKIESGIFKNKATNGGAAIYNYSEVIITGGEFYGEYAAITNRGTMEISNAFIEGLNYAAIVNLGELTYGDGVYMVGDLVDNYEGTTGTVISGEAIQCVARINNTSYASFGEALTAAKATTGDVTVQIYDAVEFVNGMELKGGNYTSITFIGKSDDAKMTINQSAGGDYIEAHGKTVAFENIALAKANPQWSGNSGHMGNYFSIQGGTATYTNCTFLNGACTSGGTATYNNCTFKNESQFGLWVYDDALVTVNNSVVDSYKGIKVYSEGETSVTSTLKVENTTFTSKLAKPAVAIGYAVSVELIGNTYNNTTDVIELDSGADADCEGITFVAQDANGNDIASTLTAVDRSKNDARCGVLMDGKIYTSVATAADESEIGNTITLLYDTEETIELPAGVALDLNDYSAPNVTIDIAGTLGKCYISEADGRTRIYGEITGMLSVKESVVVDLYSGETKLATTTLNKSEYLTSNTLGVNIVIAGEASSSWITEWHVAPIAHMIPNKAVLYLDGEEMNYAEVTLGTIDDLGEPYVWGALTGVKPSPAMIGYTGYATLQDAINAAVNGDEIKLYETLEENVTVPQAPDVAITINGNSQNYRGTITVDGKSKAYPTAALTIKNFKFNAYSISKDAVINLGGNNNIRYTNNVTVENCSFTGNAANNDKVGVKSYTGGCKNFAINGCTADGMHSLIQLYATTGVTVADCNVTNSKNGVSVRNSSNVAISNCEMLVEGYGVRTDANSEGAGATITDCTIDAFIPVVVRKATQDYTLNFEGENNFTENNEDNKWCVIGTEEYGEVKEDGTVITLENVGTPTGFVMVTLNDANLSYEGVYGGHTHEAMIGETRYVFLQDALDAVEAGEQPTTIEIIRDVTSDATVSQVEGENIIIDGNGFNFSGTIYIEGNARHTGVETLAIQNFNFTTEKDSHDFISSNSTESEKRYAHNVTVKDCVFTATEESTAVVGMRFRQAYKINVEDCNFYNLHSVMWATGTSGATVKGIVATGCKEGGISFGTSTDLVVENAIINVVENENNYMPNYGIRVDASVATTLTVKDSEINAYVPVVARSASANYTMNFEGENTMTAGNDDNKWCVIGKTEYKTGAELPNDATGNVIVNLNDEGLSYDGVHGNFAVAKIGNVQYPTFAAALEAAQNGATIELIYKEGDAPIAMNGALYGKNVTVTGTATVDWSKGWLFIGRGGEGDAQLTFNNANLTSASDTKKYGINVSGKAADGHAYDGTLRIEGHSNIEVDYIITRNRLVVVGASTLTAKNGFVLGGRPAEETVNGNDATASVFLTNNAHIIVKGNKTTIGYEGKATIDLSTGGTSFKCYDHDVTITEKGIVNLDGATFNVTGENAVELANNGTVNVKGNSSLNIQKLTGNAINFNNVTIADAYIGGAVNAFGTNNFSGETNVTGILSVGYYGSPAEQVVVNIAGDFNGTNVLIGSSNDHVLNLGNADGERTRTYFGQLGAFGDVNIVNSDVTYGYAFVRNDFNVTNSTMDIIGGVNTYFAGNAKVVVDNSTWSLPGYANIGSYGGYQYGSADVTLKNGSSMTATGLGIEVSGDNVVKLTLEDNSTLTAKNLTNRGSIVLAGVDAKVTSNELTGTNNVPTTSVDYKKVAYVDGSYVVIDKDYVAQIIDAEGNSNLDRRYESFAEALNEVQNNETIELINANTLTLDESTQKLTFERDIEFNIEGVAPEYKLPIVTFRNATVNINDAEFRIPELDARTDAVINVNDSKLNGVNANDIVKAKNNGVININGESVIHTMQLTTMGGVININDKAQLNATWQINAHGNGLITVNDEAQLNAAALNLISRVWDNGIHANPDREDYAQIIVDGATLIVGKVTNANGSPYDYNSEKYGINIGTYENLAAVLDIINGATVEFYMNPAETDPKKDFRNPVIGTNGVINIDASTFNVISRTEGVTLICDNAGTINVTGASVLNATVTGEGSVNMNDVALTETTNFVANNINFAGEDGNSITGAKIEANGNAIVKDVKLEVNAGSDLDFNKLTVNKQLSISRGKLRVTHFVNDGITSINYEDSDVYVSGSTTNNNVLNISNKAVYKTDQFVNNSENLNVSSNSKLEIRAAKFAANSIAKVGGEVSVSGNVVQEENAVIRLTEAAAKFTTANTELEVVTTVEHSKVVYTNGAYVVVAKHYVAYIGETGYESLQEAFDAAEVEGTTIELSYNEGDAPISMNASLYGKNVTITGNATVDWAGWLYVGRGGIGNAELTFENANLTSSSSGEGINVSCAKNTDESVCNGKVVIKNSTIELPEFLNRNIVEVENSTITTTHVTSGGRPANETAGGLVATAEFTLTNSVLNALGNITNGYEGIGIMNVDANSNVNVDELTVTATGTLNSAGNITGEITKAEKGIIQLTGGIYTTEPQEGWCAENYGAIELADGTWFVRLIAGIQSREFATGWYWFSTYIQDMEGTDGITLLKSELEENGKEIKSHYNGFTRYYKAYNTWTSGLTSFSTSEMYMINTSAPITVDFEGEFVEYENRQIDLVEGWNWIGYPVNKEIDINTALKNHDAKEGDFIKGKNQDEESWYYEGWGWEPSFNFKPGHGYMYESTQKASFTFNAVGDDNTNVKRTTENYHWNADATQYPTNMTMVAIVDGVVGNEYEVAAFANGEVRGSARPMFIERLNTYVLILTIHGDEVEEVSFKYYDIITGEEVELSNRINYTNDAIVGSMDEPYMLTRGTTGIGEAAMSQVNIYPNPTTTGTEINLQTVCDTVEVFNALGVKVAEYQNVDSIDALETAGIYVIRITNDSNVQNCRLVVK